MQTAIKLQKSPLYKVGEYAKNLLPIFTQDQFSLDPPLTLEDPYLKTQEKLQINANEATTKHFFIPFLNKEIILVGLHHNSVQSGREIYNVIQEFKPDTVVSEICEQRYKHVKKIFKEANTAQVIEEFKNNKGYMDYLVPYELYKQQGEEAFTWIIGDQDLEYIEKNLRKLCKMCEHQNSLPFQFQLSLLLNGLRTVITGASIPMKQQDVDIINNQLQSIRGCQLSKFHFKRDYHLFQVLLTKTYGTKIAGFVGLSHLLPLTTFLTTFIETIQQNQNALEQSDVLIEKSTNGNFDEYMKNVYNRNSLYKEVISKGMQNVQDLWDEDSLCSCKAKN